jgi:hypothetical protein
VDGEPLPDREVMSVIGTGWDEPMPLPLAESGEDGEEAAEYDEEPLRGGEQL